MAISCSSLFEDVSDAIGQSWGSDRLQKKFLSACNMALSDLSHDADLATDITAVSSLNDSIALDASHYHVVLAGVLFFMIRLGIRPADPKLANTVYIDTERMWTRMKGQYARVIDNALQPTQSDNMENLGYLDEE